MYFLLIFLFRFFSYIHEWILVSSSKFHFSSQTVASNASVNCGETWISKIKNFFFHLSCPQIKFNYKEKYIPTPVLHSSWRCVGNAIKKIPPWIEMSLANCPPQRYTRDVKHLYQNKPFTWVQTFVFHDKILWTYNLLSRNISTTKKKNW